MHDRHRIPSLLLLAVTVMVLSKGAAAPSPKSASPPASGAAEPAPVHFVFHNRMWANLHHFLHAMAARDGGGRRVRLAAEDVRRADALEGAEAEAWSRAVDHYRGELAARDLLFDERLRRLGGAIAATPDEALPDADAVGEALAAVLAEAAVVYRNTWWARHRESNARWSDATRLLLERHGELAPLVARAYQASWPSEPIPVLVCAYANWAGAYTTNRPPRITIASMDRRQRELVALETMYHEAAHTFRLSLQDAIAAAAADAGKPVPDQLWHAIIFFTSGALVQRVVDPAYEPYADRYGLWQRGAMRDYHRVLSAHYRRYLDGAMTLDEAIGAMVNDL